MRVGSVWSRCSVWVVVVARGFLFGGLVFGCVGYLYLLIGSFF